MNQPRIRLHDDTGNIVDDHLGADPAEEREKVKHFVHNVHLKAHRGGFEDCYFPAVGDRGRVDFRRIREVLDGLGFAGPDPIEIEGIDGEPEPGLEGCQRRIEKSVQHLKKGGCFDRRPGDWTRDRGIVLNNGSVWELNPPGAAYTTPHWF